MENTYTSMTQAWEKDPNIMRDRKNLVKLTVGSASCCIFKRKLTSLKAILGL